MNTNDIRQTIEGKLEEEQNTGTYFNLLQTNMDNEKSEAWFNFTIHYLRNTPDFMDQVYSAASEANCLATFQHIFDASFTYWNENNDYIPDHLGIAGICDDAYLSMSLMQKIANSANPSTNQALIPGINSDLQEQNNLMANLLGPVVTEQLNAVSLQTYQSIYIQDTLNNLFQAAGMNSLFGTSSLSMMHNMLQQNRIDEQVNTQLGAMGIF